MKILITGTPGTGKTLVAKELGKLLKARVINEKDLALEKKIGTWDHENDELEIPLEKLKKAVEEEFGKKDVILEGHVLCEVPLDLDLVIVLRVHPEILELRLENKGYHAEKIQDNVFCEGIDYCKKHALKSYVKEKVVEVRNEKNIKETTANIIQEIEKRK